jgi:hypothetical protein
VTLPCSSVCKIPSSINPFLSCWGVRVRNLLPMLTCSSAFPILFYTSFKVLGLKLRSLIHFKLIFVQGEKHGSSVCFLPAGTKFFQQHLLKRLSFLPCVFWAHSCMDSHLGILFYSFVLHVCFFHLYYGIF